MGPRLRSPQALFALASLLAAAGAFAASDGSDQRFQKDLGQVETQSADLKAEGGAPSAAGEAAELLGIAKELGYPVKAAEIKSILIDTSRDDVMDPPAARNALLKKAAAYHAARGAQLETAKDPRSGRTLLRLAHADAMTFPCSYRDGAPAGMLGVTWLTAVERPAPGLLRSEALAQHAGGPYDAPPYKRQIDEFRFDDTGFLRTALINEVGLEAHFYTEEHLDADKPSDPEGLERVRSELGEILSHCRSR